MQNKSLKIGLVQMASVPESAANFADIRQSLEALAGKCDLAVLPENCLCLGAHETVRRCASSPHDTAALLKNLTADFLGTVIFGGVAVRAADGRIFNRSLVVDAAGEVVTGYDKMHLFQLAAGQRQNAVDETELYAPGAVPVTFDFNGWGCGLSICYDLRFPELFRQYVPAPVVFCTAAFTKVTGEAHWELLLRARAVENQCFIVGVNQCGVNFETGIANYGSSMVVDPWGEVLARAGAEPEILVAEIGLERLEQVRLRLPVLTALREEDY